MFCIILISRTVSANPNQNPWNKSRLFIAQYAKGYWGAVRIRYHWRSRMIFQWKKAGDCVKMIVKCTWLIFVKNKPLIGGTSKLYNIFNYNHNLVSFNQVKFLLKGLCWKKNKTVFGCFLLYRLFLFVNVNHDTFLIIDN